MFNFTPPDKIFQTTDQLIMWSVNQRMKVNRALDQLNRSKTKPTQDQIKQLKQARHQVNKMILKAADDMLEQNQHDFNTVREIRDFMYTVRKEVKQTERETEEHLQ